MARRKVSFNFDPDSAGKVRRRLEAERAVAEPSDEDQARSVLDEFPSLLHIQTWRRHLPAWTPPGPRRRPS